MEPEHSERCGIIALLRKATSKWRLANLPQSKKLGNDNEQDELDDLPTPLVEKEASSCSLRRRRGSCDEFCVCAELL